ncbi:MAG: hypothetical protein KDD85_10025 [Parvularculaceae bacterium]|nr:hypothetical protein [Parvularculaceae bacterium]
MKSDAAKLAIAVLLDILDFSILSLMPGVGMVADIIMGVIALVLWGPVGLFAFWEALNPVEPVDAFVPTMTLIALSRMGKGEKKIERSVERQ